jgi:hypothetical protein
VHRHQFGIEASRMSEPTREFLRCAAALLDQGRTADYLSRILTAAALGGILIYPAIATEPAGPLMGPVALVALAGLGETYFAIRVAFDRVLFDRVASAPEAPDFAGTDDALVRLRLMPASKAGRPVDARVAGARRRFRFQIFACVAQVVFALAGALAALTSR